jgi:uncharacterized membrane protein
MTLITRKCAVCHSLSPQNGGSPPNGLTLETLAEVRTHLTAIRQVVRSGRMPLGNISLSAEEKNQLLSWEPQP